MRRARRKWRVKRFFDDVFVYTPFTKMVFLLVVLWLLFAAGLFLAERGVAGATVQSYGQALYWAVAAFSTAGIADTPVSGAAQLVGGLWIVVGSTLFFGAIVATRRPRALWHVNRPMARKLGLRDSHLWSLPPRDHLSAPTEIHLSLTYACPLRCPHCYADGGERREGEASDARMRRILEAAARAGVFHVAFGGGETLAHPGWPGEPLS